MNQLNQNHLLPFLWIHGESHDTYRAMVKAIYDANIRAFCVEARPHKAFGRQQWWDDLEAILTEAEKYGMRVWILDDKHFPTGYANGGVKNAPLELQRQHLCHRQIKVQGGKTIRLNLAKFIAPKNGYNFLAYLMLMYVNDMRLPKKYKDDCLFSCSAWKKDKEINLQAYIKDNRLVWDAPAGEWTIDICSLSRNTGFHRSYINMMEEASCRILIDEVYQPHYEHFKERFGHTIEGFFSDEPELGNGNYLIHGNVLGTDQSLPFSRELNEMLSKRLGEDFSNFLPLLWESHGDEKKTAYVRYTYMDCVSRLVEKDFSRQIGGWCDEHGVSYIGHVIEDNNQHARTSTSLGHFFRGLKWQHMSGIDDIGGQVYPGGEDYQKKKFNYIDDGEFYHYALGKLGVSLGEINPRMNGRTMCEVFGNYGWSEGVRLEKYLVDHFMVRGVNYFVPHAFNSKAYPDRDCPPHFHAHGNDPQYRHFGMLMAYTNRICNLISDGRIDSSVAILYHAEAEWSGAYMLMQKPARLLYDSQIDYTFIPGDVFAERDFYKTEIGKELSVNGHAYSLFLIPYAQFITKEVALGITQLLAQGCKVAFIDALPQGICTGEELPEGIALCDVIKMEGLIQYAETLGLKKVRLDPPNNRLRCLHYFGRQEIFYLFNEGDKTYNGTVALPINADNLYEYDAWHNRYFELNASCKDGVTQAQISLEPSHSLIIVCGDSADIAIESRLPLGGNKLSIQEFTLSVCRSIDYPNFSKHTKIYKLESYDKTNKNFSGFIRYETAFTIKELQRVMMEITEAYEGVEVFINGQSAGIQVMPTFLFDLTQFCIIGTNELVIEVATTLERERGGTKNGAPTGIVGEVNLYFDKE